MENKKEVKVFRIHYICDICSKGEMLVDPGVKTIGGYFPNIVPHICNNCKYFAFLPFAYPRIAFEEHHNAPEPDSKAKEVHPKA